MSVREELVEKGFQLAWFLYPERETALLILAGALDKLTLQRGREARRSYWRDKHLKRSITRITREESDALQWLICFESETYEKLQEQRQAASLKQLIVRYVKSLVRITTAMSSFHVNVGFQRLLYSYSTEEAQRFYEALTEKYLGSDEYRRAKAALMQKLQQRFGSMLETVRGQHGELRFAPCEDQEHWTELLQHCLSFLTPWSTAGACPIPRDFARTGVKLSPQLSGVSAMSADADRIEINRCHAFIDPTCFGRLAEALALDAPLRKLALPRFHMPDEHDSSTTPPPARLTAEERHRLNGHLEQQSARRRSAELNSLRILLDGVDIARFGIERSGGQTLQLQEGAELIEVVGSDSSGDLVLGVYPVPYDERGAFSAISDTLTTRSGAVRVEITPAADPHSATLSLTFEPKESLAFGSLHHHWRTWAFLPRLVLPISAAVLLGFWLGRTTSVQNRQPKPSEAAETVPMRPVPEKSASVQLPKSGPSSPPPLSIALVPDELATRSAGGGSLPRLILPEQEAVVRLEMPVPAQDAKKTFSVTLKTFDGAEVLAESSLHTSGTAEHPMVVFEVPSGLLRADESYSVLLRARTGARTWEEVTSYTFQTEAGRQR